MTIFSTLSLRFLVRPGTRGCIRPVQGGREVRARRRQARVGRRPAGPGTRRARPPARLTWHNSTSVLTFSSGASSVAFIVRRLWVGRIAAEIARAALG